MKIAILGGAGAMGALLGGTLAQNGVDVTLVDVAQTAVDAINTKGLRLEDKAGVTHQIKVKATTDPATVDPVDYLLVFVKCYQTESAVRAAAPMIGAGTTVLSLQNGWGNAPRIAALVGQERVMAGVTYHSATVVGPGQVKQTGIGDTFIGELGGGLSDRQQRIVDTFNKAGFNTIASENVLTTIWMKLALNCCTLPASALLRFTADEMVKHDGTLNMMSAILKEVVAVANAQDIPLSYDERWEATTGLLRRAVGGKASMLQDVENKRRTEIDVVNGAIVEAGQRLGIPTPYNQSMVWLVKALEETF
jgi:2-dehydropantoate 2-reductase